MDNSKRAKISDICPTGRQGKDSALTDAQKTTHANTCPNTRRYAEQPNNKQQHVVKPRENAVKCERPVSAKMDGWMDEVRFYVHSTQNR